MSIWLSKFEATWQACTPVLRAAQTATSQLRVSYQHEPTSLSLNQMNGSRSRRPVSDCCGRSFDGKNSQLNFRWGRRRKTWLADESSVAASLVKQTFGRAREKQRTTTWVCMNRSSARNIRSCATYTQPNRVPQGTMPGHCTSNSILV